MAQNERLRTALMRSGKTAAELAAAAGVDPKTFERWITKGRTPHRVNAARAAAALGEDVSYLWPDIERGHRQPGAHPDLIAVYATPVLHLRRASEGGLFDGYADSRALVAAKWLSYAGEGCRYRAADG